jgi:hypothetical protein
MRGDAGNCLEQGFDKLLDFSNVRMKPEFPHAKFREGARGRRQLALNDYNAMQLGGDVQLPTFFVCGPGLRRVGAPGASAGGAETGSIASPGE